MLALFLLHVPVSTVQVPGAGRGGQGVAASRGLARPARPARAHRHVAAGLDRDLISDLTCPHTCPSTDLAVGVVPAHPRPQTRVQADPGAVQAASPVRALTVRAAVAGGGVAEADKY